MRFDPRRGRRAPAILLLAVLSLVAAACGGDEPSPSGGSGGLETSSITIGVLPVVDVAPAYLADKEGFFRQEGLTVRFQPAQGGAALIPALVAGDIQVAFSNYVSLFLARSQGIDLSVVAEGVRAKAGFSGVFTMPDSAIEAPADLAGKKVAVNTLNNVGDVSISAVLRQSGVDPRSVRFIEVPFPDMGPTLQRGEVDAVWVVEPFTSSVKATLNARRVIDPFSGPTDGLPVAGYAVSKRFADDNPNTVAALVRALDKAADAAADDPAKVAAILPSYTSIKADVAAKVTQPAYLTAPDTAQLQRVADLMRQFGKVGQDLDVASFTRSG